MVSLAFTCLPLETDAVRSTGDLSRPPSSAPGLLVSQSPGHSCLCSPSIHWLWPHRETALHLLSGDGTDTGRVFSSCAVVVEQTRAAVLAGTAAPCPACSGRKDGDEGHSMGCPAHRILLSLGRSDLKYPGKTSWEERRCVVASCLFHDPNSSFLFQIRFTLPLCPPTKEMLLPSQV